MYQYTDTYIKMVIFFFSLTEQNPLLVIILLIMFSKSRIEHT